MDSLPYLYTMLFGVGVFLAGLVAYFDHKIHEYIGLGVMLVGILLMLIGMICYDLAGFQTAPFQL